MKVISDYKKIQPSTIFSAVYVYKWYFKLLYAFSKLVKLNPLKNQNKTKNYQGILVYSSPNIVFLQQYRIYISRESCISKEEGYTISW